MESHAREARSEVDEPARREPADLLPVRMLNESVYCPRLFYLMHVLGEWAPSVDTAEGKLLHKRVDSRKDAFPTADPRDSEDPRSRSRSIMFDSQRLGIIAKMDIVEHAGGEAVPVEYKHGHPPHNPERAWLPERVQLCAQGMVLEDQGWTCDHGIIYYPASRERVEVPFDEDLRAATVDAISEARRIEASASLPPPLESSPKCPRCSLVGICLPDETQLLMSGAGPDRPATTVVRRLVPSGDDALPLHLCTPGSRVGLESRRLVIRDLEGDKSVRRLKDVSHVNLYGGVQITTQAVQRLLYSGIPIGYFSSGGWFYGLAAPIGHSAVELRRRQYARSVDANWSLRLACDLVRNKIRNARTLLRRNCRERPEHALARLRELADQATSATATESLLGIEGLAAREYFGAFNGMLRRVASDELAFDFRGRNRRPPRDPVNAMLSLAYALLTRHLTAACAITGLDPHVGFFHADRPGRPSLALDLMEPFRPLIADSAVITAVNNGEVQPSDFVTVGDSTAFTSSGRKRFIGGFERRLDVEVRHPVFGYRMTYRRILEVQTRLLARHVFGELDRYPPFETR
jgi:CRISPR-associated endonuclease Cas1/CRISPR-associated protein Cas4